MKKELREGIYAGCFFVLLVLFASFVLGGFFDKIDLSPYFPDFSPFNATITIITNFPPEILDLSDEILVCEGQRLSGFFNVSDLDGDSLIVSISPPNPFFVLPGLTPQGQIKTQIEIFSGILGKNRIGAHQEVVSANDGQLIDTKQITIDVIEINNAPSVTPIGVQTVWTHGDDSIFYKQVQVNDIEDGNQDSGNLIFNLTFLNTAPVFNISQNGTMYFVPNATLNLSIVTLPIVYNLSVCVTDRGIINIHQNISLCGQNGSAITNCFNFSLTVTDENRAPNITSHYPLNLTFSANGDNELYFNITTRDPDGTIPDVYWYVDDIFKQYNTSSSFYEFFYNFGCGVDGIHSVKAEVTDGLLNNSVQWNISVNLVGCPSTPSSGGGGGALCGEKWGCIDWGICQNAEFSFELGTLQKEDYDLLKENCRLDNFPDNCGYQLRFCEDVNTCKTFKYRPEEISHCYYVAGPNCFDSIKNCHDSLCELLTDCGGPCSPCPTCSDGIKNQGEKGVDCEGPCPNNCPPKPPLLEILRFRYILMFLILLLLIIIAIQLIRIYRARKKIEIEKQKEGKNT